MTDLVEWLETAISKREADAREGRGVFPSPSVNDDGAVWLHVKRGGNAVIVWYPSPQAGYADMADLRNWADTEHGATAADVLRRCAADRALIAEIQNWVHQSEPSDPHYSCWAADHPGEACDCELDDRRQVVLRVLAEGYGYQEATDHG